MSSPRGLSTYTRGVRAHDMWESVSSHSVVRRTYSSSLCETRYVHQFAFYAFEEHFSVEHLIASHDMIFVSPPNTVLRVAVMLEYIELMCSMSNDHDDGGFL